MKISIIVPAYNAEKYIKRCINSLINQAYKDIEVIVINDGSTDSTKKIIENVEDDRIKLINKENTGVSNSRNIGIQNAKGDYIMFADADDYFEEEAVQKIVNEIKRTSAEVVKFNYKLIKGTKKEIEEDYKKYENEILSREKIEQFLEDLLKGKINAFVWTLALKREVIKEIRFNENLGMMEDLLFYIDVLPKIKSIYIINDVLYNYNVNEESVSNSSKYYYKNFIDTLEVSNLIIDSLKSSKWYNTNREHMILLSKTLGIESIFYKVCSEPKVQYKVLSKMLSNNKLDKLINKNIDVKNLEIQRRININLIKNKRKNMLIYFNKIRAKISRIKRKKYEKSSNIDN